MLRDFELTQEKWGDFMGVNQEKLGFIEISDGDIMR